MKAWTAKLAMFNVTLPLWFVAATSLVLAAGLLSVFIDTLHENIRRGDEIRQAQVRPNAARASVSDASVSRHVQVPRLR